MAVQAQNDLNDVSNTPHPAVMNEESTNQLARNTALLSDASLSPIERIALNPEVDISKLQALVELKNAQDTKQARVAYHSAMAKLQAELPEIAENGEIMVNGQIRSRYAKFEDIVRVTKPLLMKYGFSFSSKAHFDKGLVTVTGIVSHEEGHHEDTQTVLPFDISGAKNSVQAIGSSLSYARRYLFTMLFNITTGGEDDDGRHAGESYICDAQVAELSGRLMATDSDVAKFCAMLAVSDLEHLPVSLYAKADSLLRKKEKLNGGSA